MTIFFGGAEEKLLAKHATVRRTWHPRREITWRGKIAAMVRVRAEDVTNMCGGG